MSSSIDKGARPSCTGSILLAISSSLRAAASRSRLRGLARERGAGRVIGEEHEFVGFGFCFWIGLDTGAVEANDALRQDGEVIKMTLAEVGYNYRLLVYCCFEGGISHAAYPLAEVLSSLRST